MTTKRKSPAQVYEPGWVSKQQAMEILDKSDATLERLITRNQVVSKKVPREGKVPERIYSEQSLLEIKAQLNRKPDPSQQQSASNGHSLARPKADLMAALQAFVQRGMEAQADVQRIQIAAQQEERQSRERKSKLWLNLTEAVEYSGLGPGALLSAAADRRILAARIGHHGSLAFKRSSLDAYEPAAEDFYNAAAKQKS